MNLTYVKNLSASEVSEIAVEDLASSTAEAIPPKEMWENPTTNSVFYSGFVGVDPAVPVGRLNPPREMRAFVAEYDSAAPETETDLLELLQSRPASKPPYMPTYAHKTASGGLVLVWLFEKPMLMNEYSQTEAFLKDLSCKYLRADKWAKRYALNSGAQETRFQAGHAWMQIGFPLPFATLGDWYAQSVAARERKLEDAFGTIPLKQLEREIERFFRGSISDTTDKTLRVGTRTKRFWDAGADAAVTAVAVRNGFVCWEGPTPFIGWGDILSLEVLDKFKPKAITYDLNEVVYDGNLYWAFDKTKGIWGWMKRDAFQQDLRILGYESKREKGQTASSMDVMESAVRNTRRVEAVAPLLHRRTGPVMVEGKRWLNISTKTPVAPSVETVTLDTVRHKCPIVWEILTAMFGMSMPNGETQLEYFLAWLKHAYVGAHTLDPSQGLALFIAGLPGAGKTILNWQIIEKLLGGNEDGTAYLVHCSEWTSAIVASPVVSVDDSEVLVDEKTTERFADRLKSMVANPSMQYNEKYMPTYRVQWMGRIVVTCNTDPRSIQIIPALDNSSREKVMMLMATCDDSVCKRLLPGTHAENNERIHEELPYFASFLLHYTPEDYTGYGEHPRFGMKTFHHPFMISVSKQKTQVMLEILDALLTELASRDKIKLQSGFRITGMAALDLIASKHPQSFKMSHKAFVLGLSTLQAQGYHIGREKTTTSRYWVFYSDSAIQNGCKTSQLQELIEATTGPRIEGAPTRGTLPLLSSESIIVPATGEQTRVVHSNN